MTDTMQIRNEPLGDQVARVLRRRILSREIGSGLLLIEQALSEEFGVSRGPIRDALSQLRDEGLVAPAGRSHRVLELTAGDITEVYDIRHMLERHAIARSLRAGADLSAASAAIVSMRAAAEKDDALAFGVADLAFHRSFQEVSGQRRLLGVWSQFERTMEALLQINPHPADDLRRAASEHADLLAAVQEDDPAWPELLEVHLMGAANRFIGMYMSADS
ncbi:GntR family transcriptional regulator [Brevibacterium yomogidense]